MISACCCSQLLAHRFPSHPDFDPNGRGVALKPSELDIVLGVVEQKIANPHKIGIMHESAFVLRLAATTDDTQTVRVLAAANLQSSGSHARPGRARRRSKPGTAFAPPGKRGSFRSLQQAFRLSVSDRE